MILFSIALLIHLFHLAKVRFQMALLSPLDLLSAASNEQDVIRCLIRQPFLTALEISRRLRMPIEETENLLRQMVQNAQLKSQENNGQTQFSVPLGREKNNTGREKNSLLNSLFG